MCRSHIGRNGGQQKILLDTGCGRANVIHVIIHALGFGHEHSRKDRHEYVTIQYENIMQEEEFTTLYNKCLNLAAHSKAKFYLAIISFVESSFFPIPPDVMVVPMVISKKDDFFKIFLITTIFLFSIPSYKISKYLKNAFVAISQL